MQSSSWPISFSFFIKQGLVFHDASLLDDSHEMLSPVFIWKRKGKNYKLSYSAFRVKCHNSSQIMKNLYSFSPENVFEYLLKSQSWQFSDTVGEISWKQEWYFYAPRRISGEHIVAASSVRPCVRASVRPCVRPALVHANSRKLLVGFQWNFMGILSIKGGCAYHLRVLVRWFFQELLPFDEFCMNI